MEWIEGKGKSSSFMDMHIDGSITHRKESFRSFEHYKEETLKHIPITFLFQCIEQKGQYKCKFKRKE